MSYPEIEFKFEIKTNQLDKPYIKMARSIIRKLFKLFPVSPSLIIIHIFQNRPEFLKEIGKPKAPDWLVAYVPEKSTSHIFILKTKKLSKAKKLSQIFTHEIAHLYTNKLNPNLPDWLKEGLSVYVAEQIFSPVVSKKDWRKITSLTIPFKQLPWEIAAKYNGYNIAGLLVLFFVKRYGWRPLLSALRLYKQRASAFKTLADYFSEQSISSIVKDFQNSFVK